MKRALFLIVFVSIAFMGYGQKKVAVWEVQRMSDNISVPRCILVRGAIEEAVDNTPGYNKYDRAMFDAIIAEHNFQLSGAVEDEDMKQAGKMAGVQYVIVPECAIEEGYFILNVRILDVESGKSSTVQETPQNTVPEIKSACTKMSKRLLSSSGGNSQTSTRSEGGNAAPQKQAENVITITVGNVNFDMVKVEAGSFVMGCTSEQGSDCWGSESPYHRVTITQDYYIGKFEVTQELYEAVMGVNPSNWKAFDRPVENVSWNDAQDFCAELSRITGRRFSLPTEAEWEYAARGGKKSTNAKYSGGSSVAAVAWYDGNSGSQTHPVGRLRPNELGVYDMSGNVCEWCQDWYGDYGSASQTDPMGSNSGYDRVLRGGCWGGNARICRVANRSFSSPGFRGSNSGFRVVLVP